MRWTAPWVALLWACCGLAGAIVGFLVEEFLPSQEELDEYIRRTA